MGEFLQSLARILALFVWAAFLVYPIYRLLNRKILESFLFTLLFLMLQAHLTRLMGHYDWISLAISHLLLLLFAFTLKFLLIGVRCQGNKRTSLSRKPITGFPDSNIFIIVSIACLSLTLSGIIMNLQTPATGWDALTYHLEFPAQWLDQDKLGINRTYFGDLSPPYYPQLAELCIGWLLAPGLGSSIAELTQIFWGIFYYFNLREILYHYRKRWPRHKRPTRLSVELLTWLFFAWPWVQSSMLVADNDIALLAGLSALWLAVLRIQSKPGVANFFIAILCLGVVLSLKTTGLVYSTCLMIALFLIYIVNDPRQFKQRIATFCQSDPRWWQYILYSWAALALLLITGAFWYLRNYLWSGNPMWPAEIQIFGYQIFEGYYPVDFYKKHAFHSLQIGTYLKDPGLLLPGLSLTLLMPGAGWRNLHTKINWQNLILPMLATIGFIFIIPLHQNRLSLPIVLFCAPLALALLNRKYQNTILIGMIVLELACGIMRLAELYHNPLHPRLSATELSAATLQVDLLQAGWFTLLNLFMAMGLLATGLLLKFLKSGKKNPPILSLLRRIALVSLITGCTLLVTFLLQRRNAQMYAHPQYPIGNAYAYVLKYIENTQKAENQAITIAIHGSNARFALRGMQLKHKVYYITDWPRDLHALHIRRPELIYIPQDRGWFEIQPEFNQDLWRTRLFQLAPDFLFLVRNAATWGPTRKFIRQENNWTQIYTDTQIEIYRAQPAQKSHLYD